MPVLTSLKVSFYNLPNFQLNLVHCLVGCPPSLKSLTVKTKNLAVEAFTTKLGLVEKLEIRCEEVTNNLGDIISSCFPNLVDLTLKGSVAENLHIALKNPHFQKATLLIGSIMVDKEYTYGFSFKAPNLAEGQCYICDTKGVTRVQHEDLQDMPVLSIEAFTEKKLKVDCDIKIMPC